VLYSSIPKLRNVWLTDEHRHIYSSVNRLLYSGHLTAAGEGGSIFIGDVAVGVVYPSVSPNRRIYSYIPQCQGI
jgi:hypothetical protein